MDSADRGPRALQGTKAGVITAGVLTGAGIIAGVAVAVVAGISNSLRFNYAP